MSISVMKQALDAITNVLAGGDFDNPYADLKEAGLALRQAIEQFECPRCGHCCRDGLERLCRIMGTFDLATGHADTMEQALDALESELRDVLGHLRARREWVGLTDEEIDTWNIVGHESLRDFVRAIEAKLKEKNNG